jgi:hypothetical protein
VCNRRARKREGTERSLGIHSRERNLASTIGILLREDITGCSGVSIRLRKRRVNLRIFNGLWGNGGKKRGHESLVKVS